MALEEPGGSTSRLVVDVINPQITQIAQTTKLTKMFLNLRNLRIKMAEVNRK